MVKRRFSALFLTLTLLLCTLPAAAAEGDDWLVPKVQEAPAFTDMAGVWCEDAVQTVCQTGLMQGRSDGSFNPSGALMPAAYRHYLRPAVRPAHRGRWCASGACGWTKLV